MIPAVSETASARQQLRILFVEDSLADAELCLRELRKVGFAVTADIVQTPEELADRIQAHGYDVVLADYRLPCWTGIEALAQLRQAGKDIPFILVTGTLGDETAAECIKQGAADYVLKDRLSRLPLAVNAALQEKAVREERRRAEEALRESQRTLATLISNLPGMVYRCRNDRDWTMEFVSEGCIELTGYPPADLIENRKISYAHLIHPEDRESISNDVQAALRAGEAYRLTYRLRTADDAEKWVWEQGRGVFSPEGEIVALEGFITDITDRKRLEAEARQHQRLEDILARRGAVVGEHEQRGNGVLAHQPAVGVRARAGDRDVGAVGDQGGSVGYPRREGRQAQHRRSGRQDVADPCAISRRLRRRRADDVRPRPRAHGRHPRQARGDSRVRDVVVDAGASEGDGYGAMRADRSDRGHRASRQEALCAPRCHGDRRKHSTHLGVDHE